MIKYLCIGIVCLFVLFLVGRYSYTQPFFGHIFVEYIQRDLPKHYLMKDLSCMNDGCKDDTLFFHGIAIGQEKNPNLFTVDAKKGDLTIKARYLCSFWCKNTHLYVSHQQKEIIIINPTETPGTGWVEDAGKP